MKYYFLFFTFFYFLVINAQVEIKKLQKKEYSELSQKVRENIDNKEEALIYAKAYLAKAKAENSQLGKGTGYRLHANIYEDKNLKISYLDSAINTTLDMDNKYYPALLLHPLNLDF